MYTEISITGGTGFVGSHLVTQLIINGYSDIKIFCRGRDGDGHRADTNAVKMVIADLAQESSIPEIADTKVLIHLAYCRDDFEKNINIASNIIKASQQHHIQRIIHCSTAVVSGFTAGSLITETTHPYPMPGYQENKFCIEQMLLSELPPKLELVILRPTIIIGSGGPALNFLLKRILYKTFYSKIMYWLLKNRRLNFVGIENVVEAILFFIRLDRIPDREIFLVSDDDQEDNFYGRVDQLIRKCLGKRLIWPDIGLPAWFLRLIFRLLPLHSPPDSIFLSDKLYGIGYSREACLNDCIKNCIKNDLNTSN